MTTINWLRFYEQTVTIKTTDGRVVTGIFHDWYSSRNGTEYVELKLPDMSEFLCDVDSIIDIQLTKKKADQPHSSAKMSPDRFKELLDELDGNSLETLKEKNARYSQNGDCLHNFRSGAEIVGGTPAQACWGYLTKHLVALRDMVNKNDFSNREDFLEKCQDTINYIRFLWCIGNEEENNKKRKGE